MTRAAPPRAAGTRAAVVSRPPGARKPSPGRERATRLRIGRIVLVVALALATVKLVTVQTLQAGELKDAAERQRTVELTLPAERGAILDRNGAPFAFSVEARALVASPRTIARELGEATAAHVAEMATAVADATGVDRGELMVKLRSDRAYVVLADRVDPDVARAVRERFPLIAEEYREERQYPGGPLASSTIGYSRWDAGEERITGRIGLESSQDNLLAGSEGLRVVDTAEESSAIIPGSTQFERPVTPGSDLQLTLDSDLQFTVQRALGDYVARSGAGIDSSAVVLDATTSEVLALANGAAFDPRDFAAADPATLGNPSVSSPFEPGSVNKIVTMAAALEYGVASPDDVLTVPGSIRVADSTISDAWDHGTERYTLTGVLAKSSNVGTIMTAQRVGEQRFAEMLARFGIGERTGVGLPGESAGRVPPRETWSGSTFGNLPIGQGLSMTVLQMAGMYQAVANDGLRVPPRIIAATVAPDGVRTPSPASEPVRVVSPETAVQLRTMLTAVTQDPRGQRGQRGTGHQAAVPGYLVAGKTGTAQQVDPNCRCYASHTYWITFAGMFPAQDPRYVIAIMLDAPGGGTSAAPLFQDIASYIAQRERLPVSAEPQEIQTLVAP